MQAFTFSSQKRGAFWPAALVFASCIFPSRHIAAQTAAQKTRAIELVARAADVFGRGQYTQTIQLCREAVRNDAKYVRAYTWLGAAYQKSGRSAEARNAFGRVLQLAPSSSDATRARRGLRELNVLARADNVKKDNVKKSNAGKSSERVVVNSALPIVSSAATNIGEGPVSMWRADAMGVRTLAWSPNGQILASGGGDRAIHLWNPNNGAAMGVWKAHDGEITGVAWSPDGKFLASSSYDNTVRIWHSDGRVLRKLEGDSDFNVVAWSNDNRWLAAGAGNGNIRLWDAQSGRFLRLLSGHENGVSTLQFGTSSGQVVLISASLDASVRLWNLAGDALRVLKRDGPAISVLSPDGSRFASGHGNTIRLHSTQSGTLERSLDVARGGVQSLAWSPDSDILAAGYYLSVVRLWDARIGGEPRVLRGLQTGVRSVEWSPDGRFLAAAAQDGSIAIWRK